MAHPPSSRRNNSYPESVDRLIAEFASLPGIGRKTAERLAFHVLKSGKAEATRLARAIDDVKTRVRHCSTCFNLADADPCAICSSESRDHATIMVVEQPKDLIALEQTGSFKGVYHVLMGRISPLDGVGPGDLTIGDLLKRVEKQSAQTVEVVLALNPNLEGDGTALYLVEHLRLRGAKVTRLARGVPTGSQLEYASKAVLADAIEGRGIVP